MSLIERAIEAACALSSASICFERMGHHAMAEKMVTAAESMLPAIEAVQQRIPVGEATESDFGAFQEAQR